MSSMLKFNLSPWKPEHQDIFLSLFFLSRFDHNDKINDKISLIIFISILMVSNRHCIVWWSFVNLMDNCERYKLCLKGSLEER